MKSFMYAIFRTKSDRNGNRKGEVKLWTIKRNTPNFIGTYYFTFESDDQALINMLEEFKLLPRKYLSHGPMGGHEYSPYRLTVEKVANFYQL